MVLIWKLVKPCLNKRLCTSHDVAYQRGILLKSFSNLQILDYLCFSSCRLVFRVSEAHGKTDTELISNGSVGGINRRNNCRRIGYQPELIAL